MATCGLQTPSIKWISDCVPYVEIFKLEDNEIGSACLNILGNAVLVVITAVALYSIAKMLLFIAIAIALIGLVIYASINDNFKSDVSNKVSELYGQACEWAGNCFTKTAGSIAEAAASAALGSQETPED